MMYIDWQWQDLVVSVISLVLGWLANVFRPAPGTMKKP